MTFDNFTDFHNYIREMMVALNTNTALADIEENTINSFNNDTYIVTMDKQSGDLNFFSRCGVHMTWLSLDGSLPSIVKWINIEHIIDIAECDITVQVNKER